MIEGGSVTITQAMSDPVPTCTINVRDNTSSYQPQAMQEVIVLDDQVAPNPTMNLALNPDMNPYTTSWSNGSATGLTFSQNPGGGTTATISNIPTGVTALAAQLNKSVTAGLTYVLSGSIQGSSTPTNIGILLKIRWYSQSFESGLLQTDTFTGPVPASTSLIRYSLTATAPAGARFATILFDVNVTNATNSGVLTITQAQFEPLWFPTLSYPTPFCGPNQTNCTQIVYSSIWIRQHRKFAGFLTHAVAQDYHGNARTWVLAASGYAWLAGLVLANNSYTSQTDSFIIADLLAKYFTETGNATVLFSTTNVVTGVTLSNFGANWDDIRTLFDNLASQSGFYWTIDYYLNMIYAPPGYITMPISLLCDGSGTPNNVTTFPAYTFSAELDYTQPGSVILVIGSGTNVAEVIDPETAQNNGITSGYFLPTTTTFMRKINDSTLQSTTDCTNRGMAELLQYDTPRNLYHLTTNVELIPGQGIAVTSNTDGLNATVLLIQSVTATWIGTSETLTDQWEYVADLGATNRHVTNILSRLFRIANKNTSAPAISTTTLAVVESVGINDTIDSNSLYAQTVLADSPIAYYRLGEPAGFSITTAYDWGGSAFNGTISGGVTLGEPGAIFNDTNTAMLFDGSTGFISLPTNVNGNGQGALSVELWLNLSTASLGSFTNVISAGVEASNTGYQIFWSGSTALIFEVCNGTSHARATYTTTATAGNWLHLVGTYDGSNVRFYVNSVLRATTAFTGTISASANPVIAATTGHSSFTPGTIDEVAVYATALSQARIQAHYNVGTLGHT